WWTGMANPEVEILISDTEVRDLEPYVFYPGVEIRQVTRLENPNYLFVLLHIGPGTRPGTFAIELLDGAGKSTRQYPYELRARSTAPDRVQGLDASDLIYLIMPDRFANGDPGNDSVEGMQQTGINRDKVFFRHGGDLIGIMERLDYLGELGVTALWLNPVFENDEPYESYHGYAPTDHYHVDARLGTNEQYQQLVRLCHERGIKVVMDVIFNHVGDQHWFIRDLPSRDWIHQWPVYTKTTYRAPTLMDPYASAADRARMADGWFDKHMPDLNQSQPQLANYLIQNSIWWAAYTGQDAYRIDTYAYADQAFMSEWNRRMLMEFPTIGIYGEIWDHGMGIQAWFGEGDRRTAAADSHLPGVTDYQIFYAILEALSREQGWTDGVMRLYYTLAQDYLYADPFRNVLFLDNHDLSRFYTSVGEDLTKFKSGIALLLTLRGIPMLYYGTEILMTGSGGGAFGEAGRRDFPGGWSADEDDFFRARERREAVGEAFDYVQRLAQYRRSHPELFKGALTQFVPEDGVYVYFRHAGPQTLMVIFNSNEEAATVTTERFAERMGGYRQVLNVITGEMTRELRSFSLPAKGTLVLELQ
ncbi:MAG: glycoside hydrolase family 13 protein, partial [Lewinella sp.]|nr:glycoside hydrolase family 13 protein [Lewinella sp.]